MYSSTPCSSSASRASACSSCSPQSQRSEWKTSPVLDQVGDRDQLDVVAPAELDEVGDARHRPVLLHHLADDARGVEACEPCEVNRGFRLARATEHAALACAQREYMARLDEVDGAF